MTDRSRTRQQTASVPARTRLGAMLVIGVAAAALTGFGSAWASAPLVGWDAAALSFIVWAWGCVLIPMGSTATAVHATREDPGRAGSDLIVVTAAVASLAAVGLVLVKAASAKGSTQDLLAGLAVASVALSWISVHTLFTLSYARLYYTGPDGGIDFKQKTAPRYLDFAYLAFTIGMTFQVSDTDVQSPAIRAVVLRHALLSYLFGAVILATTINLIAGLGTSGGG